MINRIIDYIKSNRVLLSISGALLALLVAVSLYAGHLSNKNKIYNINLKAATEQMDSLRLANGDLLVEKQSYVLSLKELEDYLNISNQEVKDLQKSLNNKVLYISELEEQVNIAPTEVHDTMVVYRDSSMVFDFKFGDEWYNVDGTSVVNNYIARTQLNNISMNIPLKVGLTDDWQIFATTSNPYVSFSSIDGALLDKNVYLKQAKPKHWNIGVQVGFGAQYGLVHKTFDYGPYLGVGVSYGFSF